MVFVCVCLRTMLLPVSAPIASNSQPMSTLESHRPSLWDCPTYYLITILNVLIPLNYELRILASRNIHGIKAEAFMNL